MTCQTKLVGYFFLVEPTPDCRLPTPFWLGAAAIVLILSFFGFLVSRLLRCSPLAMVLSRMLSTSLNALNWHKPSCLAKDSYRRSGEAPFNFTLSHLRLL